MKVDKAVCTTDTLDDLSRVIKFEAIFSSLVENKILAIKRECEQQKQKNKKKCLLINKTIDNDQEKKPLPHDPTIQHEESPKIQPTTSSNHFRKILFGKKLFGTKSKFKDRGEDVTATDDQHPDDDHKFRSQNIDECELNELNFYHHTRLHHLAGDIEKGEMAHDDDDDDDDDDVTIGPDNSSILLSDDATLKSEVKIDIDHLDDNDETSDRPQLCDDAHDRESCGLNKKLRVTYNDRNNCIKTKSNSSIGGTSSKDTSIYIENERTRLRLLEAKSISAQCSPVFQRQKLSELPRYHVTSFDETKKVPHPDYDQITSLPITNDDDHHHHHHRQSMVVPQSSKPKTTIKINKPRIEYDSIISYNQSTATTTTTSNTSSSPGFISTFNQLTTSASSSNQIPIITTIKSSTSSSTTGSNKSIKTRRPKDRSTTQNQSDRHCETTGAIHKTNQQVIDDNQSAINKTNNNSNNSDSYSKNINNRNINNSKNNNDNNVSNKNSNRNKNVIRSQRDHQQHDYRNCDDSDEEFRKHRRKYRRTQRYSDPVLVFPSSSGLQHCILSRPPNQPLQLQYDEDFIYDVSLQLEPGDGADLDDIMATGRRKHRHRHHRHGKKKRHKRRKMLIHDLDDQTVKVIDPDDLPQRARWTIIATAFLLLIMCLLLVGVTLRMAPIIDDMVNKMAYSTQTHFLRILFPNQMAAPIPDSNRYKIKDYDASTDLRSWSLNKTERAQYLLEMLNAKEIPLPKKVDTNLNELNALLEARRLEIEELKKTIKELQEKIATLACQLECSQCCKSEVEYLQKKLDAKTCQLQVSECEINHAKEEIKILKKAQKELEEKFCQSCSQATKDNEELVRKNEELECKLQAELNHSKCQEGICEEMDEMRKNLKESCKKIQYLTQQNNIQEQNCQKATQMTCCKANQIENLEKEISNLKSNLETLQCENSTLKSQVTKRKNSEADGVCRMEDEMKSLQSELNEVTCENCMLQTQLKQNEISKAQISLLQNQNNELRQQLKTFCTRCTNGQNSGTEKALLEELDTVRRERDELKLKFIDLEPNLEELASVVQDYSELETSYDELSAELDEYKVSHSELVERLKSLLEMEGEFKELQERVTESERLLNEYRVLEKLDCLRAGFEDECGECDENDEVDSQPKTSDDVCSDCSYETRDDCGMCEEDELSNYEMQITYDDDDR